MTKKDVFNLVTANNQMIELRRLINETNQLIEKMSRSSYFFNLALPDYLDRNDIVYSAVNVSYEDAFNKVANLNNAVKNVFQNRRNADFLNAIKSITVKNGSVINTLQPFINYINKDSIKKRTTKYSTSIKTYSNNDYLLLSKIFKDKPSNLIRTFINLWYENINTVGNISISQYVKNVYTQEYAGIGSLNSWGSYTIISALDDLFNSIEINKADDFDTYDIQQLMNDDLYDLWMQLFQV